MSWCFFAHKGEAKINAVLDKVTKNHLDLVVQIYHNENLSEIPTNP